MTSGNGRAKGAVYEPGTAFAVMLALEREDIRSARGPTRAGAASSLVNAPTATGPGALRSVAQEPVGDEGHADDRNQTDRGQGTGAGSRDAEQTERPPQAEGRAITSGTTHMATSPQFSVKSTAPRR